MVVKGVDILEYIVVERGSVDITVVNVDVNTPLPS